MLFCRLLHSASSADFITTGGRCGSRDMLRRVFIRDEALQDAAPLFDVAPIVSSLGSRRRALSVLLGG